MRRRILVATPDVLAPKMAGPGIRAFEMARILARDHDVELVSTVECELVHPEIEARYVDDSELRACVERAEIVIVQGWVVAHHPWITGTDRVLVVDLYDPFHLETLEQARDGTVADRRLTVRRAIETLNVQLQRGDFFVCATEQQRDFWLGQLTALGRVNPATYDRSEGLERLIQVVPFGISDQPPRRTRAALKGVVDGIGPDDPVVLWGGGIYNWFDPLTLLRAVDRLRGDIPNVRLYFMGLRHPNPQVPTMRMATEAVRLAGELGLLGTHVFFNEDWVDYDDRSNYLLEADVGVSTHLDHVETRYSFRTRILDYLWASLPVVATRGDALGDLIESHHLGLTVAAGDVDGLATALAGMLEPTRRGRCAEAIEAFAPRLHWETVLEPLVEFCAAPERAADRQGRARLRIGGPVLRSWWGRPGWRIGPVIVDQLRHRELAAIGQKVLNRLVPSRRRLRSPRRS